MSMNALLLQLVISFGVMSISFGQSLQKTASPQGTPRERLFFSIGLGGSVVTSSARIQPQNTSETIFNETNIGPGTSFRIGHAINTNWIIYYQNYVSYAGETTLENRGTAPRNSIFSYGLTGIGVTKFQKATSPSAYFSASFGLAGRQDFETIYKYAEKGMGWGLSIGTGYQFADRWGIESTLVYGRIKGRPQYDDPWQNRFWMVQIGLNYIWFKSFKEARKRGQKKEN